MRLEYFQMVDRVEALDAAAGTITARADVPRQSTVFEGHFPGYPLLPGVLMVECMAQTAGYLILVLEKFERMPFLAQIDVAKLRRIVEPGATLTVDASLEHLGSGYAVTKAAIRTETGPVADAGIRFRTVPFPTPAMRELVLEHARRLGLETPMRA